MGKKRRIRTDGDDPLSSNPFAGLGSALGDLPEGTPPQAPSPAEPADAPPTTAPGSLRGKIVIRREKKGRGGKTATVIEGLGLDADALGTMARSLRKTLGCGATVEGDTIVLSGAQSERARDWLAAQGAGRIVLGN